MTELDAGGVRELKSLADYKDHHLYGFGVNQWDLRPSHRSHLEWLADFLVEDLAARLAQAIAGHAWTISLEGYASQTGQNEQWNRALSRKRVVEVELFLTMLLEEGIPKHGGNILMLGNALKFEKRVAHGSAASPATGEDPFWRAVRVVAHRPTVVVPPPPASVPAPARKTSTTFQVEVITGLDLSLPLPETPMSPLQSIIAMYITDTTNHLRALYLYDGRGISLGLPGLPDIVSAVGAGSVTTSGKPFFFRTGHPMAVEEFGGDARIFVPPSISFPTFLPIPPIPIPKELQVSVSAGDPILDFRGLDFLKSGFTTDPKILRLPGLNTVGLPNINDTMGQLTWAKTEESKH